MSHCLLIIVLFENKICINLCPVTVSKSTEKLLLKKSENDFSVGEKADERKRTLLTYSLWVHLQLIFSSRPSKTMENLWKTERSDIWAILPIKFIPQPHDNLNLWGRMISIEDLIFLSIPNTNFFSLNKTFLFIIVFWMQTSPPVWTSYIHVYLCQVRCCWRFED